MYVSAFLFRVIATELRRRSIVCDAELANAGVTPEQLLDPTVRIPVDRFDAFVRSIRQLPGKQASAGLYVGETSPTSGYLAGHLFTNAGSIREAIDLAIRYGGLLHETMSLRLVEDGELARVIYESGSRDPENARFEAEAVLVVLLRVGQLVGGRKRPPLAVSFTHAAPATTTEYVAVFGCEPTFGATHNAIVFPRAQLDVPNAYCDPSVSAVLERRAEVVLAERGSEAHLVDHVRDLVRVAGVAASPSIDAIAASLGTSPRVLQRRLRELGTSLSVIGEDVRRTLACEAVLDANEPIKQVADRLGFSEPSAFYRAFKRWTGTTPQEFRAKHAREPHRA